MFVYFVQPGAGAVLTGGVLIASLVIERPLVGRFAGDFLAHNPEGAEYPTGGLGRYGSCSGRGPAPRGRADAR